MQVDACRKEMEELNAAQAKSEERIAETEKLLEETATSLKQIADYKQEVEELKAAQAKSEERVAETEKLLKETTTSFQAFRSDICTRVGIMDDHLSQHYGKVKAMELYLDQICAGAPGLGDSVDAGAPAASPAGGDAGAPGLGDSVDAGSDVPTASSTEGGAANGASAASSTGGDAANGPTSTGDRTGNGPPALGNGDRTARPTSTGQPSEHSDGSYHIEGGEQ